MVTLKRRLKMKHVLLCAIPIVLLGLTPQRLCADAVTIDVLSQTYSLDVYLPEDVPPTQFGPVWFHVASSGPNSVYLSDLLSPSDPPLRWPLSSFQLQTHASGDVKGSSATLEAVLNVYRGQCSSELLFRPSEQAILTITVDGWRQGAGSSFQIQLVDVTGGGTMLHRDLTDYGRGLGLPGYPPGPVPWTGPYEFTIDPTHVYLLSDSATTDNDLASATSTINLTSVPDSVSTTTLLALGLAGLAGLSLRKRGSVRTIREMQLT
jgi:hypothetical protein